MEGKLLYLLSFIFGGLAYSDSIFCFFFFSTSLVFFVRKYLKLKREKLDLDGRFLVLMSYSLPFSWISIIGSKYESLPISWFVIFEMLYLIAVISIKRKIILKKNLLLLLISLLTIVISVIPLLYSSKLFFSQAVTQFLVLIFNNVLIFVSIFRYGTLKKETIILIRDGYIYGAVLTSCMLIIQYILYNFLAVQFGRISFLLNRELFYYLFTDISHGTLYLATAAFWLLYTTREGFKNTKKYFLFLIIVLGSAVTSARTGLFVLLVFSLLFILIGQKGILKKITTLLVFGIAGYYAFQLIQNVRDLSTVSDLTNSSGRLSGYESAFKLLKQSPLIGYGYSQDYLAFLLDQPIPHLSILQYALHGGVLFSLLLFLNQMLIWLDSLKKKTVFSWLIAIVLMGTCLVPDLFATRFITLLCVVSISGKHI